MRLPYAFLFRMHGACAAQGLRTLSPGWRSSLSISDAAPALPCPGLCPLETAEQALPVPACSRMKQPDIFRAEKDLGGENAAKEAHAMHCIPVQRAFLPASIPPLLRHAGRAEGAAQDALAPNGTKSPGSRQAPCPRGAGDAGTCGCPACRKRLRAALPGRQSQRLRSLRWPRGSWPRRPRARWPPGGRGACRSFPPAR